MQVVSGSKKDTDPALVFPGPIALVAGPGSGKTTRLAHRIKHLVEDHEADPESITVLTFTREAARNMKDRLTPPAKEGMPDVTLPPDRHPPIICTMHSLGWTIIRKNADRLGMTDACKLLPNNMRQVLFEDAARLCGEDIGFGKLCAIRKAKLGKPTDDRERSVFDAYRRILQACNTIDYDDQIILACQLLEQHDDIREVWQTKANHLLVDEYQDINRPQLELIQLLSGQEATGLFVVGDDDQSIYGFRGAEPSFTRDFATHFNGGQIMAIADCFRCQPHVIQAAHSFIEVFNPDRIEKPEPICVRTEGSTVMVHNVPSDRWEAKVIVKMIVGALRDGDVLILMPKPDYAEPLKVELRNRRIAFDAPTMRDSDATLVFSALQKWLTDANNNLAFRELIQAMANGGALNIPGPRVRKKEKVSEREKAMTKISSLWNHVADDTPLREAVRLDAPNDELYAEIDSLADQLAQATSGSLSEFGQRTFEALKPWPNSRAFLEELATSNFDERGTGDGDANLVRIMTMRNAKGLEAETVFVIGLEEGAFPSADRGTSEFEEDARLFYVSMTRAKENLHLFHARTRSGGMTYKPQSFSMSRSPFLDGLSDPHCDFKYHQSAAKRTRKK